MSRHELAGRDPCHRIVVGWDHPMLTYFVHVHTPASDRIGDGPEVWLGGNPRELYDLPELKRAIGRYADLSQELLSVLYLDRDEGR